MERDYLDLDSSAVGPPMETAMEPYVSAGEFYADYPLALGRKLAKGGRPVSGRGELT